MNNFKNFLEQCLPENARFESVRREKQVFVLRFIDRFGVAQEIELWDKSIERRCFRAGRHFAFAYRPNDIERADREVARDLISALLASEDRLLEWVRSHEEVPLDRSNPGRTVFLREKDLALRMLRALPRAGSVRSAATLVLEDELAGTERVQDVQIYFETRCAEACEFCEEPSRRETLGAKAASRMLGVQHALQLDLVSSGAFGALIHAIADRGLPVTVTGHDWTKHPWREKLLRGLEEQNGLRLRLQGPSLEFDSLELARRVSSLSGLEWVATTLQSSDPSEHDAMVGASHAHSRLMRALENLESVGVRVQLSLVLTRRALRTLAKTLCDLDKRGWSVELVAFVPDRAMGDVREKLAPLYELRSALEEALPAAEGAIRSIVGVPICAVPVRMRGKVARALRTNEREALQFSSVCGTCEVRSSCSGVPATYLDALGMRGMVPTCKREQ